jgi:aryl-alcohol dehydrogenase-like predicted oxidoreductase
MATIGIGTASWGQEYAGKRVKEIDKILDYARCRVEVIDTAPAYNLPDIDFTGFDVVQKTPYKGDCYALLAHDPNAGLPKHKTAKIGVSVYTPEELERYIDDINIVQLPLSIADGRFLSFLPRLRERGVEIHARSIFMRGLLLKMFDVATCLGYVLAQDIDVAIVGVNSLKELKELCRVEPRPAKNLNWPGRVVNLRGD